MVTNPEPTQTGASKCNGWLKSSEAETQRQRNESISVYCSHAGCNNNAAGNPVAGWA
jgi:hypothetical protein